MLLAIALATLPKQMEWHDEVIFIAVVFCTAFQMGYMISERRESMEYDSF